MKVSPRFLTHTTLQRIYVRPETRANESGEFAKVFLDFHTRLSINPSFNLPGKYYVYCIKDVCVYFIGLESKLLV